MAASRATLNRPGPAHFRTFVAQGAVITRHMCVLPWRVRSHTLKMDATLTHSVQQSVADVLMAVAATNGLRSLRHSIIISKARRTRSEGGRNRTQCKRPS